jgi:hypothetical protein
MPLQECNQNVESFTKRSSSLAKIDGLQIVDFDASSGEKENDPTNQAFPKSKSLSLVSILSSGDPFLLPKAITLSSQNSALSSVIEVGENHFSSYGEDLHEYRTTDRVEHNNNNDTIGWISSDSCQSVRNPGDIRAIDSSFPESFQIEHNYSSEYEQSESDQDSLEDDDSKEMDYSLVNELIENELNRIHIESKKITEWTTGVNPNKVESKNFGSLIYIIETYNKVIVKLYKEDLFKSDEQFRPIEIEQFLNSLLNNGIYDDQNNNMSSCFETFVFYLIKIWFFLGQKQLIDELVMFNLTSDVYFLFDEANNQVIKESRVIPIELLAFFLIKSETCSWTKGDKSSYLQASFSLKE